MSESCYRGHKCMCFQCGEKDCEKYQPEPPEWFKKSAEKLEREGIAEVLREMREE